MIRCDCRCLRSSVDDRRQKRARRSLRAFLDGRDRRFARARGSPAARSLASPIEAGQRAVDRNRRLGRRVLSASRLLRLDPSDQSANALKLGAHVRVDADVSTAKPPMPATPTAAAETANANGAAQGQAPPGEPVLGGGRHVGNRDEEIAIDDRRRGRARRGCCRPKVPEAERLPRRRRPPVRTPPASKMSFFGRTGFVGSEG